MHEFGSIGAVMASSAQARTEIVGQDACRALDEIGDFTLLWLREKAGREPIFSTTAAVLDYARALQAEQPVEMVRVLFLDAHNHLLRDEQVFCGTIDEAPIWPREILRSALERHAAALILIHNHPSGDPQPSDADIAVTRSLVAAAAALGVTVHDHVIVARRGHVSFREAGLLS